MRKKDFRLLMLVLVGTVGGLLIFASMVSASCPGMRRFQGYVTLISEDGPGLAGVTISVRDGSWKELDSVVTDVRGHYESTICLEHWETMHVVPSLGEYRFIPPVRSSTDYGEHRFDFVAVPPYSSYLPLIARR